MSCDSLLKLYLFTYFMHMSVLPAHIFVYYLYMPAASESQEKTVDNRSEVIDGFQPSYELWKLNLGPLEVFLTIFPVIYNYFNAQ